MAQCAKIRAARADSEGQLGARFRTITAGGFFWRNRLTCLDGFSQVKVIGSVEILGPFSRSGMSPSIR